MRYRVSAVIGLVALMGCDDGPVDPPDPPLAMVDPSLTELVGFNDAGQALWNEDGQAFLWDGSEVRELPFSGIDLGPAGGVAGHVQDAFFYWKGEELTEIPDQRIARGIDGEGRVYVTKRFEQWWWTPEQGFSDETYGVGGPEFVAVGEDGSILLEIQSTEDRVRDCFRETEIERVQLIGPPWDGCWRGLVTQNGLVFLGVGGATYIYDTRTDPWKKDRFEFGSWDMNENMVFVTHEGEVKDAEENILKEVDADQALINRHNEVLVMSPEGHIRIIE